MPHRPPAHWLDISNGADFKRVRPVGGMGQQAADAAGLLELPQPPARAADLALELEAGFLQAYR